MGDRVDRTLACFDSRRLRDLRRPLPLTGIDATNVQPESRKPLVELAREFHVLPVANDGGPHSFIRLRDRMVFRYSADVLLAHGLLAESVLSWWTERNGAT
jgi:hypothetical protein